MEMPEQIRQAITFLERHSLAREEGDRADGFGSRFITYRNGVGVRIVSDRGDWYIEVSDSERPDEWYDMALLRDILEGGGDSDVLGVDEQVAILTNHWNVIQEIFAPTQAAANHTRLQCLQEQRAQRRFPEWYK